MFEILAKDLAGRVGRLHTKSGVVETPALFPVVDVRRQDVSTEVLGRYFKQVITNSYFIYRLAGRVVNVKELLKWGSVVMTDSGAYQILKYGTVDVDPDEILLYQWEIGSDIGVILDLPFDYEEPYHSAVLKVEETLRRAKRAAELLEKLDMLVVAPIQGALYRDLLVKSTRELSKLDFHIYAIGSPTTLLEEYKLDLVLEMVATVKSNLQREAAVHLFGAGHPLILPFAVALGVDLFDSASYILYARDGRIMLRDRTLHLDDVKTEYLPCSTRLCYMSVEELREMPREERILHIAEHNLAILREELLEIKQRIHEGTLWEYLEIKARAHPSLYRFLKSLHKRRTLLEAFDPETHPTPHGLFFYGDTASSRPEPCRHWARMTQLDTPRRAVVIRVETKPYTQSWEYGYIKSLMKNDIHVLFYDPTFGIVPEEVAEVYPLSQNEGEGESEEARAFAHQWLERYDEVYLYGVDFAIPKAKRLKSLDDVRYIA